MPCLYCLQDDSKLYKNNEIANLIVGLGLGLKGEELGNSLRYGKVRQHVPHIRCPRCCNLCRYCGMPFSNACVRMPE